MLRLVVFNMILEIFNPIYILYSIVSFFSSYLIIKKIIPFLRKNFLQVPNNRSSHSKPIPSGGGIVFVLIGTLFTSLLGNYSPLIILPLAAIGFLDDLMNVNKQIRLFIQIFSSFLILINSKIFVFIENNLNYFFVIVCSLFLIFLAVAIINFFNFMDGMDGLVSGCMVIYLIVYAYLHEPSFFPLITSLIAFFIWNLPPARIFMGDVGSTFLGAILVICIFSRNDLKEFLAFTLLASPLLLDSSVCIIRRFLNSENVFKAHKLHLYQRLHQSGWSHLRVSSMYFILTFMLCIGYIIFGMSSLIILSISLIPFGFFIEKKFAVPFCQNENI